MTSSVRIVIALLAAASVAVPAGPAQAAPAAKPAVQVAPGLVYPQVAQCAPTPARPSGFTVSGTGFKALEKLTVTIGGLAYGTTVQRADAKGRVGLTYEIKARPSGWAVVEVRGDRGSVATTKLNTGYVGCRYVSRQTLRMTGVGFAAADTVKLFLDGAATPAATAATDQGGRYDVTVACPAGSHTANVTGTPGRTLNFPAFTC